MKLISGRPYWPSHNPPAPRYPSLRRHASCEIAVIGGGYSGALIGYSLTADGADVLLVDRRDFGMGSTAASTALIEYQLDSELYEFIELAGARAAVRAYRLSRNAVDTLEGIINHLDDPCDWERKKGLHLASSPHALRSLRKEYRARKRYRFGIDYLTKTELAREYEVRAPGGLLYDDAAQVDPYRLTHALIRCAARAGMQAYARTGIVAFEHGRGSVVLKTARGWRIRAKKVVFASGYESLRYLPKGLAKLVNTYALVSQPFARLPRGVEECVFTETRDPYLYVRTTADNRVMIGGEDDPFVSAAFRERCLPAKKAALVRKFKRWFPALRLRPVLSWAGAFAATKDGLGYVDETSTFPNAYFALGVGGNGMIFSVIAAGILRDLCRGKRNPDRHLFRFDRPGAVNTTG